MNKIIKILIGLLLIFIGIYTYLYEFFRDNLIELIKLCVGNIGLLVIFVGLMFILIGLFE